MTKEIKYILENYKYKRADLNETKSALSGFLNHPEFKIHAQALLALLFNELTQEDFASVDTNQDYFLVIVNGTILNPGLNPKKENILIYKDKIIATSTNIPDDLPQKTNAIFIIDAQNSVITPGFIDQHIHGGYGCDFNNSSIEEMINLSQNLPQNGITSILPTVMTASENIINEQIRKIKIAKEKLPKNSTKFLGIHLEGPYLSSKYKGIQPESDILIPNINNFKRIEDQEIKIVSYAPELDNNFELTRYLSNKNIIPSAAHSAATSEEIKEAAKNGLRQITHLFNAMSPLHHRNPGIIGEALTNDDLYVEIISDGLHLDPIIIDIIIRTKPDSKIIFISDSLPLNNAKTESIIFGGQEIFRKNNKAVNQDGTLAGSLIFLDSCVKNITNWNLSSFSNALKFSSLNIAQNLGKDDLGYIDKDKIADLIIWDNNQISITLINGQIAYKK